MSFQDYESLGYVDFGNARVELLEAYRGKDVTKWYYRIKQSLINLLRDAEKAHNSVYATDIKTYLGIWTDYPLDGSIDVDTLEKLISGAKPLSNRDWKLQSYFHSLESELAQLLASEQELPRDVDMDQNSAALPGGGGARGGGGSPAMSPAFGPEKEGGPDEILGGGGGGGGGEGGVGGGLEGPMGDALGNEMGAAGGEMPEEGAGAEPMGGAGPESGEGAEPAGDVEGTEPEEDEEPTRSI